MESDSIRDYFYSLAELIADNLQAGEIFTCRLSGEDSEFVRLNKNRIRQAGHVRQLELSLNLIEGRRHTTGQFNATGDITLDRPIIVSTLQTLRAQRKGLEDDPYLLIATQVSNSEHVQTANMPDARDIISQIIEIADGLDLVGIWASGQQFEGFANAFGQRNWHSVDIFNFDWSCHRNDGGAVKENYAGERWDGSTFKNRLETVRTRLQLLEKPIRTLKPGHYRTFLAPFALQQLLALVSWGGFGLKSHRTLQTPLIKMIQHGRNMHPNVQLSENRELGLVPKFTPEGFIKPSRVELVQHGEYRDCLVSPRSSSEYGVPVNASSETPEALDMAVGEITESDIFEHLDTGLYVSNIWYSNFSDRNDCRITGMTRYACMWVENGEIAAPVNVMRFDDSLYHLLGDKLIGLTNRQQLILDPSTYHRRHLSILNLPGALIEDFTLTL